jgi:intein/homing endonuclease
MWGAKTRESTDVITIELEDDIKLTLTPDHIVYTNRGEVRASDLNEDDYILSI